MNNILNYLEYYGNTDFKELAFNDVDSLILSELVYAKLKGCAPSERRESRKIVDICSAFLAKFSEKDFKKEDYLFPNSYHLVMALQSSKRFMNAKIYYYIEEANSETQFGAMTVRFPEGFCYVAYEGTDSSIIGWREDFELMYQYPVLSQTRAASYLEDTINFFDRKIYIGGHSKGGNMAMYAFMKARSTIKNRVIKVYNFDGPGFLKEVVNTSDYQLLTQKLRMFVPEQSVIGMIFGHGDYEVVKSNSLALLQHDGFNWGVFGGKFLEASLSRKSERLEKNLAVYLEKLDMNERKRFVDTLFQMFANLNITNVMQFRDIRLTSIMAFLKELKAVPDTTKKHLVDIVKMLISGMS